LVIDPHAFPVLPNKKMGKEINEGTFTPKRDLNTTHEGSFGNLCLAESKEHDQDS